MSGRKCKTHRVLSLIAVRDMFRRAECTNADASDRHASGRGGKSRQGANAPVS